MSLFLFIPFRRGMARPLSGPCCGFAELLLENSVVGWRGVTVLCDVDVNGGSCWTPGAAGTSYGTCCGAGFAPT